LLTCCRAWLVAGAAAAVNAGAAVFDALGGGWALRHVVRFLLRRALGRLLTSDVDGQQVRPRAHVARALLPRTCIAAPGAKRHARKSARAVSALAGIS
jgi:hypothetical protein